MNEMERVNLVFIALRNGMIRLSHTDLTDEQRDILDHLHTIAENNVLFEVGTV